MTLTRRTFLRKGAMAVLVTTAALDSIPRAFAQQLQKADPAQDFPIPYEAKQSQNFYFKRETFQPYVGGVFRLSAGASSIEATLLSVREYVPSAKGLKLTRKSRPTDSFTLIFRATEKLTDLTTIYDVEHAALGKFSLFLTRRDGPHDTYFYEAVFNHAL